MMIWEGTKKHFVLECDFCWETVEGFMEFMNAVNFKKNNGWKCFKKDGQWLDMCPNCFREQNKHI